MAKAETGNTLPASEVLAAEYFERSEDIAHKDSRAPTATAFTLSWQTSYAKHADCSVVTDLDPRRDILPPGLEPAPMESAGASVRAEFLGPGQLLPAYRDEECFRVAGSAFNARLRRRRIQPRQGRFYPRSMMAGVRDISPEDRRPFRVVDVRGDGLTVDLNHPLAGQGVGLELRALDLRRSGATGTGGPRDIGLLVTGNGPGMQARWRKHAADFWSDDPFLRLDLAPDSAFYDRPRIVYHLDSRALDQVRALYRRLIPRGGRVLDLMASWDSHIVSDLEPDRVTGLGMNADELKANHLLSARIVHDLNRDPRLPLPDEAFDAVICTVSVEYLTKPLAVFAEVRRVLRPGGRFVLTFSDRWFPPKVVKVWQEAHSFERLGLVLEYFLGAGGFENLETWSLRGLPRPPNDTYADRIAESDPVFAAWGDKAP